MRARQIRWAGGLLAALLAAGCSGGTKMADVTGTVTVDGKPAEQGSISFIPVDGKTPTAGGEIRAGGKYSARVPLGKMKVEIRVPRQVGTKKLYDDPDNPNSPVAPIFEETLPEKYHNNTELSYEVKPGKNEKDWALKTR
jgi:hypothetical protein